MRRLMCRLMGRCWPLSLFGQGVILCQCTANVIMLSLQL